MTTTRVLANPADLARAAAEVMLARIGETLARRGQAVVVLAGGSTPRPCYRELSALAATRGARLGGVTWLFGDERWVPVGHPDSNEGMARRELLSPLAVIEGRIVSWEAGCGTPVDRARAYAERLGELGKPDLVLLGIGADGHTASLFPGSTAHLPDGRQLPVSPEIPARAAAIVRGDHPGWRLTLCPVYLTASRSVVFLAAGEPKRAAVARALAGDPQTPAAWIRGEETLYLVDRDAVPDIGGSLQYA